MNKRQKALIVLLTPFVLGFLLGLLVGGGCSKEERPPKKEKERDPLAVDYAAEVAQRLSASLGRKVRLVDGKKIGRIELEFYGADDREALIAALEKLK